MWRYENLNIGVAPIFSCYSFISVYINVGRFRSSAHSGHMSVRGNLASKFPLSISE